VLGLARTYLPIDAYSPVSKAAERRQHQRVYRATNKGKAANKRGNEARMCLGGGVRVYVGSSSLRLRYSAVQLAVHKSQLAKRMPPARPSTLSGLL
jgi:hypothetical protein